MPTRVMAAAALAVALVAAPAPHTAVDHAQRTEAPAQSLPVIPPPPAVHPDHRPCAAHVEWRRLETLMRPTTIAVLFDTDGRYLGKGRHVFRRGYRLCWDDGLGVVRYDRRSGLSVSWNVRDR